MKLPWAKRVLQLLVIILLCSENAGAEQPDKPESGIDALERQLEMRRHEQLVALKTHPDSELADFTTDGCSGGLSVGWEYLSSNIKRFHSMHGTRPAWEPCCIIHDQAYHTAGPIDATPSESFAARKKSDLALKTCVMETGKKRTSKLSAKYELSAREVEILYATIANLMYRAVRIGGMPCTVLPWRWGYGWPECE
jgi:hypothetical protein